MRLSRRQTAATAAPPVAPVAEPEPVVEAEPAVPPPPDAHQPGTPEAVFAGILDGQRLWIAVAAEPGRLALRDGDGAVLDLVDESADDQPGYLDARLDLTGLPEEAPAGYDVVLVPPGGGAPRRVWTPPLDLRPDPSRAFALVRDDAGLLRVRRTVVQAMPTLTSCRIVASGMELVVDGVHDDAHALALTRPDGEPLVTFPATRDGATLRATVTGAPDDLEPQLAFVAVGAPAAWQRVRRRDNALADPRRAVHLPRLEDPETGDPRLRLRWSPAGVLQLRVLAVGDQDEDQAGGDQ